MSDTKPLFEDFISDHFNLVCIQKLSFITKKSRFNFGLQTCIAGSPSTRAVTDFSCNKVNLKEVVRYTSSY